MNNELEMISYKSFLSKLNCYKEICLKGVKNATKKLRWPLSRAGFERTTFRIRFWKVIAIPARSVKF
jgi:hypothetical protein